MAGHRLQLVFIFNHRFEQNIPKLDAYYGERFSCRKYIVPFAPEAQPNVIAVFENGPTFSGHIAQASHGYVADDVAHYVFLADDLILNPSLNEDNLIAALGLGRDEGYIKSLSPADEWCYKWANSARGFYSMANPGFDPVGELPPARQAEARFARMGLQTGVPRPQTLREVRYTLWTLRLGLVRFAQGLAVMGRRPAYPLLAGYSDFVVVPANAIKKFVHYCGVFAAMNMFAELAVPTALALACDSVKTELKLGDFFADRKARVAAGTTMRGKELWNTEINEFSEPLEYSWKRLLDAFPTDRLYLHPVKLSKWN